MRAALRWALSLLLVACSTDPALPGEFVALGAESGHGGLPRRVRHAPTGITLVLIEPGSDELGAPPDEAERDGDEPQYVYELLQPFYLAETELTRAQWARIMRPESEASAEPGEPGESRESGQPAELPQGGLSWHDAQELLRALHDRHGRGWRLPTESQWEYACRAGSDTAFSFGPRLTPADARYDAHRPYADGPRGPEHGGPAPVRSHAPNAWGLYDMHGNLFEWCSDLYVVDLRASTSPSSVPGAPRVIRGGAWSSKGAQLRSAYRDGYPPNSSGEKYGVRLAFRPSESPDR